MFQYELTITSMELTSIGTILDSGNCLFTKSVFFYCCNITKLTRIAIIVMY
jgi:hypothetical protein